MIFVYGLPFLVHRLMLWEYCGGAIVEEKIDVQGHIEYFLRSVSGLYHKYKHSFP